MKLTEVLNAPSPIKWQNYYTALFAAGDQQYRIDFDEQELYGDEAYYVTISNMTANQADRQGMTGTGNEYVVFATSLLAVQQFVAKMDPAAIAFTANEPSREKLYNRLVSKFAQQYEVEKIPMQPGTEYVIRLREVDEDEDDEWDD